MISEAMRQVAELLAAGGIRVFVDSSEINPPGVLIQPPTLRYRFHKGDADLDMSLIVIVGNNESRRAIDQLSELVADVQRVLGDRAAVGRPAEVFLAEQSASLRAYELTYSDTLRIHSTGKAPSWRM
jgi:hypothetical protein